MKVNRIVLCAFLVLCVVLSGCSSLGFLSENQPQRVFEKTVDGVTLRVECDKEEYLTEDDVNITVTVKNESQAALLCSVAKFSGADRDYVGMITSVTAPDFNYPLQFKSPDSCTLVFSTNCIYPGEEKTYPYVYYKAGTDILSLYDYSQQAAQKYYLGAAYMQWVWIKKDVSNQKLTSKELYCIDNWDTKRAVIKETGIYDMHAEGFTAYAENTTDSEQFMTDEYTNIIAVPFTVNYLAAESN